MFVANRISYAFSKIGFVGLGNMGFPMAQNLVKNGHQVFAYDVDAGKKAEVEAKGIVFRNDVKSVAKEANIFVTMVPNNQHSKAVCQGDGGNYINVNKMFRSVQERSSRIIDNRQQHNLTERCSITKQRGKTIRPYPC